MGDQVVTGKNLSDPGYRLKGLSWNKTKKNPDWVVSYMPRPHLHVKPSRKSHVRQFSRNGVGCGYLVAVTGFTWQLRSLRGCYGVLCGASRGNLVLSNSMYFGLLEWGDQWLMFFLSSTTTWVETSVVTFLEWISSEPDEISLYWS